jgi:hypothetical protein
MVASTKARPIESKSMALTAAVAGIDATIPDAVRKEETTGSTSLIRSEPSGLLDPFHILAFKLGLRRQKLLYYCKLHLSTLDG